MRLIGMIYAIATVLTVVIVALDQLTKNFIIENTALYCKFSEIPGFINIIYVQNTGGAWGFMGNNTWLLVAITVLIMIICFAMLVKYGLHSKMFFFSIVLVLSGGIGNLIDRIFRGGQVVDFIHIEFMEFPMFNIADCTIVIGACLMVLYFIIDMVKEAGQRKADSNA